jgi:type IV secretory pathway VirB6-like protein
MQARCSRVAAMNANAVRMLASAGGGLVAISWLDLGLAGFFAAVAVGFCLYTALLVRAVTVVALCSVKQSSIRR